MKREKVKFKHCIHCGNLVGLIQDKGVDIICCGEIMSELVPKTQEAGGEKHLPSVTKDGNVITVVVGETMHPMTEEHYIQWIAVVQDYRTERLALVPTDEPKGVFVVSDNADIYSYCNVHGLWKLTLNK